jgi:hypothetical protein
VKQARKPNKKKINKKKIFNKIYRTKKNYHKALHPLKDQHQLKKKVLNLTAACQ